MGEIGERDPKWAKNGTEQDETGQAWLLMNGLGLKWNKIGFLWMEQDWNGTRLTKTGQSTGLAPKWAINWRSTRNGRGLAFYERNGNGTERDWQKLGENLGLTLKWAKKMERDGICSSRLISPMLTVLFIPHFSSGKELLVKGKVLDHHQTCRLLPNHRSWVRILPG